MFGNERRRYVLFLYTTEQFDDGDEEEAEEKGD